jgi:hypothetical protein
MHKMHKIIIIIIIIITSTDQCGMREQKALSF